MRAAWLALLSASLLGACGSNCDKSNLCSVTGDLDSLQVCDGTSFKLCTTANRGQVINCPASSQRATCTAGGWSFDQLGTPPDM